MDIQPGDRVRIVEGSDYTHYLEDGSTGIVVEARSDISDSFVEVFGKSTHFDKGYGTQLLRRKEFEVLKWPTEELALVPIDDIVTDAPSRSTYRHERRKFL